jgi:hypothetical protein
MPVPAAGPAGAPLRHFTGLRARTHGGASSRREKEELFAGAVALLDPYARRALEATGRGLLPGTGQVTATGGGRRPPGAPRPGGPGPGRCSGPRASRR